MARRARALTVFAAPASLALALAILGIVLAQLAPAAADPAGRAAAHSGEVAKPPAAGAAEQTAAEQRAARRAERAVQRSERVAAKGEATAGGAPATTTGSGAAPVGTRAATRATRRAERVARRAERKSASSSPGASAKNVTRASADTKPAAAKSKGQSEREREAKRRQREERRQQNGHETHQEKLARIAREELEAKQAGEGASGTGQAGVAAVASAVGLAPASAPESAAAAASAPAPTVAGDHRVRAASGSRSGAAQRRTLGAQALFAAPIGAAATPSTGHVAGASAKAGGHVASRRHSPSTSSPLARTVTRIIGVIPTTLWLLIGALALAALVFATSSRLAAGRARRYDRQRRELLEDVGLLQAALLPELPQRLGPVSTSANYRPASGPGAGGDFYDVFALPDGLVAVLVGDVSGHGREALPHTTLLRYTLRAYLEAGLTPREALRAAAPALERQLGGSFATVVLASYDPRARLLTYACAGHPHPLLTGLEAGSAIIACSAPPIGAGRATGTRQTVVSVPGAAVAAFYTDGVIEARTGGELYGEQRLAGTLEGLAKDREPATAAELLDRVRAQTDRRPDDMAACLLGISGGEGRPTVVREQIELDGREAGRNRTRRFLLAAGVAEREVDRVLASARAIAADHGSALLTIDRAGAETSLTLTHDNIAPLRARALARTQEVAL